MKKNTSLLKVDACIIQVNLHEIPLRKMTFCLQHDEVAYKTGFTVYVKHMLLQSVGYFTAIDCCLIRQNLSSAL